MQDTFGQFSWVATSPNQVHIPGGLVTRAGCKLKQAWLPSFSLCADRVMYLKLFGTRAYNCGLFSFTWIYSFKLVYWLTLLIILFLTRCPLKSLSQIDMRGRRLGGWSQREQCKRLAYRLINRTATKISSLVRSFVCCGAELYKSIPSNQR